jgi:tetratricopeptide (TPR) repeat protein
MVSRNVLFSPGEGGSGESRPHPHCLEQLKQAGPKEAYSQYLKLEKQYGSNPWFYLDCGDYFFRLKQRQKAILVLSNLTEGKWCNPRMLRTLAHGYADWGCLEVSETIMGQILESNPRNPHSYRDLALLAAKKGNDERAIQLLYRVVMGDWPYYFKGIEETALIELNRLIAIVRQKTAPAGNYGIDPQLVRPLDFDLRIVADWDGENTDLDLFVEEPTGELAYHSNPITHIGGKIVYDATCGYGPEEYILKHAVPGKYRIKIELCTGSYPKYNGPLTVRVNIFTNYGRKKEKRKTITLRLEKDEDEALVDEFILSVSRPGTKHRNVHIF